MDDYIRRQEDKMANNEAIKMLRTIKRTVLLGNRKFEDALDVAISALEGNVPSNNQIDRQAVIKEDEQIWQLGL